MYKKGERIAHPSFGEGIVKEIREDIISVLFFDEGLKKLSDRIASRIITRYGEYCFYDNDEKTWYNKEGFNEEGYDREGYNTTGVNQWGFNRYGKHFLTKSHYGPDGYTIEGYDRNGFSVEGIHQDTGTLYNTEFYDVNNTHLSDELVQIIKGKINSTCRLGFDGFYHMTSIENIISVLEEGLLYSRNKAESLNKLIVDMKELIPETENVLKNTPRGIQNYVRLYFRPKTPTFYYFQKATNSAILKFNAKILCIEDNRISIGSAARINAELFSPNSDALGNINFKMLYRSEATPLNADEKNIRHTEMLIPNSLSINYLDEVIFKSEEHKQKFELNFKKYSNVRCIVDKTKFF
jgi:hypothetical protein